MAMQMPTTLRAGVEAAADLAVPSATGAYAAQPQPLTLAETGRVAGLIAAAEAEKAGLEIAALSVSKDLDKTIDDHARAKERYDTIKVIPDALGMQGLRVAARIATLQHALDQSKEAADAGHAQSR